MEKILISTDFSELSKYNLNLASKFSKALGWKMDVLNVIPAPADTYYEENGDLKNCTEYDMTKLYEQQEEHEKIMDKWLGDVAVNETFIRFGKIEDVILSFAETNQYGMIAVGTRALHGMRSKLKGHTSNYILSHTKIPVLALKCQRDNLEIKKIMLPTDFKEFTEEHAEFVKKIQSSFGAELHIVNVCHKDNPDIISQKKQLLDDKVKEFGFSNVVTDVEYAHSVDGGINMYAEERGMDLLIVGKHHKKSLERLIKGFVSLSIIETAFKPILTYKI